MGFRNFTELQSAILQNLFTHPPLLLPRLSLSLRWGWEHTDPFPHRTGGMVTSNLTDVTSSFLEHLFRFHPTGVVFVFPSLTVYMRTTGQTRGKHPS